MLKKITLSAVAAATALTATIALPVAPAAAQNYGYYDGGRYQRDYRDGNYRNGRDYRDGRYYQNSNRNYRGQSYYRNNNRGCSGTTGTIIGAIAGGLLGDAAVGRRGDDTAGAIIGAGVGALAGRAIDKGDCRRR